VADPKPRGDAQRTNLIASYTRRRAFLFPELLLLRICQRPRTPSHFSGRSRNLLIKASAPPVASRARARVFAQPAESSASAADNSFRFATGTRWSTCWSRRAKPA